MSRTWPPGPRGATVVVCHTAVLAYVRRPQRAGFAAVVRDLGVTWLSNEGPGVLAGVIPVPSHDPGFLLVRNGTEVVAVTDSHGTWVEWRA